MNPWKKALLDLLFPCCCPGCGKMTDAEAPWCEDCIRLFWHPRLLSRSHDRALEGCYACCQYEEGIRRCIIGLKYNGKKEYESSFPMLLDRFPWWARLKNYDVAVPVPLSGERKKERGYNQCDLIFQTYMKTLGKRYDPDMLVRIRPTETQSLLDQESRKANVRGVFHINWGRDIRGENILLLDDVYTTGATMHEAARELKRAGASSVMGLVMASGAD